MFFWYDYLILILVLSASILIGIYFGCFGTKQATTNEYLSGGKKMNYFPIALSVTIGHISGILFVGVPADVYRYGAFYSHCIFSLVFITSAAVFVYYPVFFKEEVSSVYEYLEKKFDHRTRLLGSVLYIVYENLLLPVIMYGPVLALTTATGFNLLWLSLIICGTCVFYTAIGGLRTVIWTDILQFAVVFISVSVVCSYGVKSAGGVSVVWNSTINGQRLDIFDFDLDPTKKDSFWICFIGYGVRFLYYFCLSQSSVQKYLSLPSFPDCKKSLLISGLCWAVTDTIAVLLGLIVYANYANCDPVLNHEIKKNDEIVPFFVGQISKNISGISGLFTAMLVSASVSTLSSSLNALSGVIYHDFIRKFMQKDPTEQTTLIILKTIVVIEGILCTFLISIIEHMGEIVPLAIGITGIIDGPSVGLLTLGVLFPQTNSNGAFWGTIGGVVCMAAMYVPSTYYRYKQDFYTPTKPFSIDGCENSTQFNISVAANATTKLSNSMEGQNIPFVFRISYTYYCFIGAIVTIILGLLISYATECWCKKSRPTEVQNETISYPLMDRSKVY